MFQSLCKRLLSLFGWKISGDLPHDGQYIAIVAPHTSNWDFILGVVVRGALGKKINFLAKHQLFIPPWGWFFRAIGGVGIDRRKNNNFVDAAVQAFHQDPKFTLALAPEGTRSPVTRWKTGFYHIANKANVPIVMVAFNFGNKTVQIAAPIYASGSIQEDMDKIIDFYRNVEGKHPKTIPDYHG